jgi:tyrosyl-tRNA synthetase
MTYRPRSEFLHVMQARGYLQDCSDLEGLDARLLAGATPAYIGYDATAQSLHVGHLLNVMMLRWLQKTGHKPITLMGGGTTKVGDPSFRSEERPLLTPEAIEDNIASMKRVFSRYLSYADEPELRFWEGHIAGDPNFPIIAEKMSPATLMLNNAEWLDQLNYLDFLRDIGRHFSVNRMLSFESVKSRLDRDQSLSFLEFNYMILQAYDFLELNRRYGCMLQMGGSDQWGNIVNGIDLTRRVAGAEVFGLTSPLLTTSDGRKMGKSASGAVWLNADMLHPFEFWQFWRNTTDADVGRFLKLYTELPLDECDRLGALGGSEINAAKITLANEVTALCHGPEAAANAHDAARRVFHTGISDKVGLGDRFEATVSRGLPTLTIERSEIPEGGISIAQLLVRTGLAKSGKDARRLIDEGAARLDDAPLDDPGLMLGPDAMTAPLKLSAGKKRHALVKLAG